jgi:catechol 2,3-dioxygenase-like lactoylglutathione lyase family enzyme
MSRSARTLLPQHTEVMNAAISPSRWSVVLESPDADALAQFYVRLLGWGFRTREEGWVTVGPGAEGPDYLAFNTAPEYRRPTWPPADGEQQMMLHLDFCVGTDAQSLAEAVSRAREAGAVDAGFQPQDDVRVMLDPDGHPFCLYVDEAVG